MSTTTTKTTDLEKRIAELEAALAASKASAKGRMSVKISNKGAIMVLGMRQFPITFYASEWDKLFDMKDQIQAFAKTYAKDLEERQANPIAATSKYAG